MAAPVLHQPKFPGSTFTLLSRLLLFSRLLITSEEFPTKSTQPLLHIPSALALKLTYAVMPIKHLTAVFVL